MSYSCADFVQDVMNEADRLRLLTAVESVEINTEDDPSKAASAVLRVLGLIPQLRRQLGKAYRELRNQGVDIHRPEMKAIRKLLNAVKGQA
jgi:flavoprotein